LAERRRRLCRRRRRWASRREIVAGVPDAIRACRTGRSASRRRGTVTYVNDSKATNADAAVRALASYDNIYWILGGKAKEGGSPPRAYSAASAAPS
jgi:hypothetical protein